MASLTGLNCLLLAASGLVLLLGASSGEHRWNPEHRALWAANVQGRGVAGGRGQSKRHVASGSPGTSPRRAWVPGSKMPLHHYPSDRREVLPGDLPADDALQYLEGADTEVSVRRVAAPGGAAHHSQHHPPGQRGASRRGGAARRRKGETRKTHTRHHKQHQQGQAGQPLAAAAPRPRPADGNVTMLRTVQRGSALVPLAPGSANMAVPVVPVHADPSKTQRSLVQAVQAAPPAAWSRGAPTAWSPAPANLVVPQDSPYHYQGPSINSRADVHRGVGRGLGVTATACPADRSVLAPKEQDYVLMEKITARDGTPLDVIAGPQAGDPVSEGPHPVVGRLVLGGGQQSALCRLTYTVIVRRCGPAPPLSTPAGLTGLTGTSPRCVAGTAWGSRCHYRCPRRDLVLRGDKWVVCGDDLRWHGRPPVCTERPGKPLVALVAMTPAPRRSCPEPTMPEFGLLMCRARDDAEDANDAHRMPEGSECTVSCSPPHRLQQDDGDATQSVVTKCSAGRWNVTSWTCVRAPVPDADLDGDISAVLSDAGAAHAEDWDWKANSLTDPCSPNPCHSGGKCLRGPTNARALCQCRPGTEGERCERVLCRATCLHGGRCVLLQGRPSCFCHRGFAGSRCQALVKNVRFPAPTPVPALTTPVTTPATTPTTASATAAPSTPSAPPRPSSEAPNG